MCSCVFCLVGCCSLLASHTIPMASPSQSVKTLGFSIFHFWTKYTRLKKTSYKRENTTFIFDMTIFVALNTYFCIKA